MCNYNDNNRNIDIIANLKESKKTIMDGIQGVVRMRTENKP